jgi:hypothetical protein
MFMFLSFFQSSSSIPTQQTQSDRAKLGATWKPPGRVTNASIKRLGASTAYLNLDRGSDESLARFVARVAQQMTPGVTVKFYLDDDNFRRFSIAPSEANPDSSESDSSSDMSDANEDLSPIRLFPRSAVTTEPEPVEPEEPSIDELLVGEEDLSDADKRTIAKVLSKLESVSHSSVQAFIQQMESLLPKCCICYSTVGELLALPCTHQLCESCLQSIMSGNRSCPFCRCSLPASLGPFRTPAVDSDDEVPRGGLFGTPLSSAAASGANNPFSTNDPFRLTINCIMDGKPDMVVTVETYKTVAYLRNLIGLRWGLSEKQCKVLKLKHNAWFISQHPLKHLTTVGLRSNDTVQGVMGGLSGGGKSVKKKTTAPVPVSMKNQIRMEMHKKKLQDSAARVTDEVKSEQRLLQEVESSLSDFMKMTDAGASKALLRQALTLDKDVLISMLKTLHELNSWNMDERIKKIAHLFYGVKVQKAKALADAFAGAVEASESMLLFTMIKAGNDEKYTMRSFNTMIEKVIAYKSGASASSSAPAPLLNDSELDVLVEAMTDMSL